MPLLIMPFLHGTWLAGLQMLQEQTTADGDNATIRQVAGCFVQDVVADTGVGFKTSQEQRWDLLEQGVHVVNTYVDVAVPHTEHDSVV